MPSDRTETATTQRSKTENGERGLFPFPSWLKSSKVRRCIYLITIKSKGLITTYYIGSTVNLQRRQSQHIKRLFKGTHSNKYLQAAFNNRNRGGLWITFVVIEEFDQTKNRAWLYREEQRHILKWRKKADRKSRKHPRRAYVCANIENPHYEYYKTAELKRATRKNIKKLERKYLSKYNLSATQGTARVMNGKEARERIRQIKNETK